MSRIAFQKRQKEMKRLEKQRMKAERRAQKKLAKHMKNEARSEIVSVPCRSPKSWRNRAPERHARRQYPGCLLAGGGAYGNALWRDRPLPPDLSQELSPDFRIVCTFGGVLVVNVLAARRFWPWARAANRRERLRSFRRDAQSRLNLRWNAVLRSLSAVSEVIRKDGVLIWLAPRSSCKRNQRLGPGFPDTLLASPSLSFPHLCLPSSANRRSSGEGDVPRWESAADFHLSRSEGPGYAELSMFQLRLSQPKSRTRRRRSQRLVLSVPVVAHRLPKEGPSFYEGTHTVVVSAHGALISLAANIARDQRLVLQNALSGEEQECRIVFTEKKLTGPKEVGIEFQRPAPNFWRVAFPPADWGLTR